MTGLSISPRAFFQGTDNMRCYEIDFIVIHDLHTLKDKYP